MPALGVGGTGVLALSVPMVTAGASLALIAYALALVIARPPVDLVAAIAFGAALVLLLALVHFAARVRGAALGPEVIATQVRHWLMIVAVGVVAAIGLTAAAAALRCAPGRVAPGGRRGRGARRPGDGRRCVRAPDDHLGGGLDSEN